MTTRPIKELQEARQWVNRCHRLQKRLKLTNREFVKAFNAKGGCINHRTYGNWLTSDGNLPRSSAFVMFKTTLEAFSAPVAEPAQVSPPVTPTPPANATLEPVPA